MKSSKQKSRRPKIKRQSFDEKDFVKSLWKTMRGQEKSSPHLALLHERLEGGMCLVGLTGGIATGKSMVSSFLKKLGVPVIDTDEVARDVVRPGQSAYGEIVKRFGKILQKDRTIDRARLGEIVFADEKKRGLLESITHPAIFRKIAKKVRELRKAGSRLVVVDAALLFESDLARYMDKTIVVKTDLKTQIARLTARDSLSEDQACQRIDSQQPLAEKEKAADFVIDNSGSPEETQRQVQGIINLLKP